ncbi:tyrosinase [Russula brevipes]|nr:tyrosinase [Russula brevipes]
MSHFIVAGAQGGQTQGAAAPNRLEIRDLIRNREQFSLYIQALRAMYATPQSNSLSHFGIGGIHGLPPVPWEGAGSNRPVQGGSGGYCTHSTVLFPTWHRPYVALYEQVIQRHAIDIAKTYQTDQQRWLTAAQNLRAPYWDWASNSVPPDEVISLQSVDIITPDGRTTSVPNPLYQYTFNPVDPSFQGRYKSWRTTVRHPNSSGTTDPRGLRNSLASIQHDLTECTYRLLFNVCTWHALSNDTPGDGGSSSNSLEAIHNEIHGYIGGHMGAPSVAGFDPIFFLHHCNVDRMLSLWSALHPGVWVTSGPAKDGTFTIPSTATIGINTHIPALTPFWNSQTGFWASSGIESTVGLHYTYPEFNNVNPGAVQRTIANWVNNHYGPGRFSRSSTGPETRLLATSDAGAAAVAEAPEAQAAVSVAAAPQAHATGPIAAAASAIHSAAEDIAQHIHPSHPHPPGHGGHGGTPPVIYDWSARIHAKKYEVGEGYLVLIFLGAVPDDYSQWRTCASFVGAHVSFANAEADQCGNCREQAELVVEGFVHLNHAIAKCSGLSSYEPEVVAPYLKENLHWRVQSVDRSAIELEKLPSLEVTAVSNTLSHEPGAVLPTVGEPQHHHHITFGRRGGSRQEPA